MKAKIKIYRVLDDILKDTYSFDLTERVGVSSWCFENLKYVINKEDSRRKTISKFCKRMKLNMMDMTEWISFKT